MSENNERRPARAERASRWLLTHAGIALLATAAVALWGCSKEQRTPETASAAPAAQTGGAPVDQALPDTLPGPPARFNGQRAMQFVREVVAFGPRPVGSAAHQKLENYIRGKLRGDDVEEDSFTATTPKGNLPMRNFIVKFPGTRDDIIVVAGHYDTKLLPNFVGANDGGSSTGLLLELANELRGRKQDGYSVWLAFLDGEEAFVQWTATDSLYGSRHLAEKWQKDSTARKIKAFLLVDMIGDADLDIQRDENSTPALEDLVYRAATRLGYQSHFFAQRMPVEDDHIPFAKIGVPVADLIDLDYGYNNVFWHTPEDTLDKLSANSLEIVGSVVLETIRLLDQK